MEDPTVTVGMVIKTSPELGENAIIGSTVSVFVSSEIMTNKIVMPKLTDGTLEAAKEIIKYLGLTLGDVRNVNSELAEGVIISQDPKENIEVDKKTKVNLTVSTGTPATGSVDIIVALPKIGRANLEICVNDVFVGNPLVVNAEGQSRVVTVTGSGSNNVVAIFVDDQKIYEAYVDFTKSPAEVTNVRTFKYATYIDVTGMEAFAAKSRLEDAGFTNIVFMFSETQSGTKGTVYKQNPSYSSTSGVNSSTEITLHIIGTEEDITKRNPFGL